MIYSLPTEIKVVLLKVVCKLYMVEIYTGDI